jgi:hypothetical protein
MVKKQTDDWSLYMVRFWKTFPASEYGGLQCVVARSAEECAQVILDKEGDRVLPADAAARVEACVKRSTTLAIKDVFQNPFIIKEFLT